MPGTPTTNYELIVPTVGGDSNQWGGYLNTDLNSVDAILNVIQTNNIFPTAPTASNYVNIPSPPSGITGAWWINNTTTTWPIQLYDGTDWVSIGSLNTVNHTFISPGALLNIQAFVSSGTYTPTAGTTYAVVVCVGAGGGGAGSTMIGNLIVNNGGVGGTTTFGTLSASGGNGGYGYNNNTFPGQGGAAGSGSGGIISLPGNPGQNNPGAFYTYGSGGTVGGAGYYQGAGQPVIGSNGGPGANGGGGAGASGNATNCTSGGAGGSGGCAIGIIQGITTTAFTVGVSGAGGAALVAGGYAGGAGGSGVVVVYEYA